MRPFFDISLLAFVAPITMVNPLAVIPQFVAMTEGASWSARARVAATAGMATTCVLVIFLLAPTVPLPHPAAAGAVDTLAHCVKI